MQGNAGAKETSDFWEIRKSRAKNLKESTIQGHPQYNDINNSTTHKTFPIKGVSLQGGV